MAKYFFVSLPSYGHVYGSIPTLKELVRRGNEVICYCREDFRVYFEEAGCTFREIPYHFTRFNAPIGKKSVREMILAHVWRNWPYFIARLTGKNPKHLLHTIIDTANPGVDILNCVQEWLPSFLADIRRDNPSALLEDYMSPFGRFIKGTLDIPVIVIWPTFMHTWMLWYPRWLLDLLLKLRNRESWECYQTQAVYLSKKYKVPVFRLDDLFCRNNGYLNLILFPKEWEPFRQHHGANCKFVGMTVPKVSLGRKDFPFKKLNNKQIVYISIGTVFNQDIKFYQKCLNALEEKIYVVIMSIGDKHFPNALGIIPDNFIVRRYVPRQEILQRANLFITHGTANALSEGIHYRVPMLFYPRAYEQFISAEIAANSGLGVLLRQNFSLSELTRKVDSIMTNPQPYLDSIDKYDQR
jgi:MGT family glycosyltransferase